MVEVRNLSAGYAGKTVLHGIDLAFPAGKITVILGPNGCGKSTLLKALCGIIPAEKGRIQLEGEDLLALPRMLLARKIALLAQGHWIPDMTVERLVLHGRFPYLGYPRRYGKEDRAAARNAMAQLQIADLAQRPLRSLSGGQLQKAYIAMALAQDTLVILLDEPTTYLDVSHQLQLLRHARDLADQGKTVVMVLHDLSHGFRVADKLVVLERGRVVADGTAEAVFESGIVQQVFGVRLCRAKTESGWQYYCEERL